MNGVQPSQFERQKTINSNKDSPRQKSSQKMWHESEQLMEKSADTRKAIYYAKQDIQCWQLNLGGLTTFEQACTKNIIMSNEDLVAREEKHDVVEDGMNRIIELDEWDTNNKARYEMTLHNQCLANIEYYMNVTKKWIAMNREMRASIRLYKRLKYEDPDCLPLPRDLINLVLAYSCGMGEMGG